MTCKSGRFLSHVGRYLFHFFCVVNMERVILSNYNRSHPYFVVYRSELKRRRRASRGLAIQAFGIAFHRICKW